MSAGSTAGHKVLSNIDVEVAKGEFVAIIGASGCGKSTLARIVAGLESATSGRALLHGQPILAPGPDRGMVFQQFTLFPWLTVLENVLFGLRSRGDEQAGAQERARELLALVSLQDYEDHYPSELSGGMQQRVAIARALAPQPELLLMDEPFGALDFMTRRRMQQHLSELWRRVGFTVVFVTHDLEEALIMADRIIVLEPNPGRVKCIKEVPFDHPRNAEIRAQADFGRALQELETLIGIEAEVA
ncbi:MAG: ABC transporter ATP-binding protein [Pseudomonadota bacterium]